MSAPHPRLKRPGRAPGSANLAVAIAVLAILVPLLLKASSGAPPAAAEFAPNADKVIKQAPPGQAAQAAGSGAQASASASAAAASSSAAAASASPSASPTPSTLTIPANQLKNCVGPPPLRQTEDPQSPPCVQYFLGDNGGATAPGVTKDAVYVVVPTDDTSSAQYTALANYFNKRYEFYGRKLILEDCGTTTSGGGGGSSDKATQDSDAALAKAGCGQGPRPFASQFYRSANGRYYNQDLAMSKIITVGSYSPFDSTYLNAYQPYEYQYMMDADDEFANFGEWACNRLVGGPAVHSADMKSTTRKFGIMLAPFETDDPVATPAALKPLTDRLHACGVDIPAKDIIINPVATTGDPAAGQNAVLQLKQDGVTSIFCMCNFLAFGTLAAGATATAYHPEWVTGSFGLNDENTSYELGQPPADQMADMFGLTFHPPQITPLEEQFNLALQEGDPTQAPVTSTVEAKNEIYRSLLVIASGIQMAGPNLTPETFRDGLRKAAFPNPVTSVHAGAVGFGPTSYSMTTDAAEWYWGAGQTAPDTGTASENGTICYVDEGARHKLGDWPKGGDPFFNGTCATGAKF